MAVNDSMAFDDANANEAKENLATFLSEITKVHHDCTELGQKILEALDEEEKQSLEKLLELADFGKELADLRHCGCPGAAKELWDLEKQAKKKKDLADKTLAEVISFVDTKVKEAKDNLADNDTSALEAASAKATDAVGEKTERILKALHEMPQPEGTEKEQNAAIQKYNEERANERFEKTEEEVADCLLQSSWPGPLKDIFEQKSQVIVLEKCWADGAVTSARGLQVLQDFNEYHADLETKSKKANACCGLAAQRLRACADKASETLNILKNQTKDYLQACIKYEGLLVLEDQLETAKNTAEAAYNMALVAQEESEKASTTCQTQAKENIVKLRSKVKEAAALLRDKAQEPARASVRNTEMCRLFAQKQKQETERRKAHVQKELQRATSEKRELDTVDKSEMSTARLGQLVRLNQKVKELKPLDEKMSTYLLKANTLLQKACEQLEDLKKMEEIGYTFDMNEESRRAQEKVDSCWCNALLGMSDVADNGDVTPEAPSSPIQSTATTIVSKRQKNEFEEQMKKLTEELDKQKMYRKEELEHTKVLKEEAKVMKDKMFAMEEENRALKSKIETENEVNQETAKLVRVLATRVQQLEADDRSSVVSAGSIGSFNLVEEAATVPDDELRR